MVSDYWREGETGTVFQETGYAPLPGTEPAGIPLREAAPFLEVRNLTVRYPGKRRFWGKSPEGFTALDNINFRIEKGEAVGLTGESGCGKTTLGRALLGLLDHVSGEVLLNGHNVLERKKDAKTGRKALQMVFQDPYSSLNPKIRIGEAIEEVLRVHSAFPDKVAVRARVAELLNQVGLSDDFYDRYPHACSGGQRQRAVIARALATDPSFLVCDESVAALDVSVQAQVINLLNDLKARLGLTILFISHDAALVKYFCDRIVRMIDGKLVNDFKMRD
jgi:peptide/nickel transport system ATP-binding protein